MNLLVWKINPIPQDMTWKKTVKQKVNQVRKLSFCGQHKQENKGHMNNKRWEGTLERDEP